MARAPADAPPRDHPTMTLPRVPTFVVVSFLVACLVPANLLRAVEAADANKQADSHGEDAVTILARMHAAAGRLKSLQYKSRQVMTQYKDAERASSTKTAMTFAIQEGGKYYVEIDLRTDRPGAVSVRQKEAFDGKFYRAFTPGADVLERTTQTPRSLPQPTPEILPYLFVLDPADQHPDYATLLSSANWETLATGASVQGRKKVGNHECDLLKISKTVIKETWTYTICVARDLDYYPLACEGTRRGLRASLEVKTHQVVETPDGPVVIPTHIQIQDFQEPSTLASVTVITVDPASLQVNQPIPDSLFTLEDSLPRIVVDGDTSRSVRKEKEPPSRSYLPAIVMVNAVLILLIVVAVLRGRRKQAHQP